MLNSFLDWYASENVIQATVTPTTGKQNKIEQKTTTALS